MMKARTAALAVFAQLISNNCCAPARGWPDYAEGLRLASRSEGDILAAVQLDPALCTDQGFSLVPSDTTSSCKDCLTT